MRQLSCLFLLSAVRYNRRKEESVMNMLMGIISIIANAVYVFVMFTNIYTDKFYLPTYDGEPQQRIIQRSPASRLGLMDKRWMISLMLIIASVAVISSLLTIFGVKSKIIKIVQIGAFIASTLLFIAIMIISAHPTYTY
jgi:hypothetical protein